MVKRFFDIALSLIFLVLLSPVFIVLLIWISLDSPGGPFYIQKRVGRNNRNFNLLKFRTMIAGSDKNGLLTLGGNDARITGSGKFLRKYKLDELPQLLNVLAGQMSIVGPRPEVRKYVSLYNEQQLKVLDIRPGLTDYASLEYIDEDILLGRSNDPEKTYIEEIMPAKLELNLKYIHEHNLMTDIRIIFRTLKRIASGKGA